ncbi:MAG: hypothetical protein IPJ65_43750 [Archangiaceae bacterium]|nr:hypothetical protein [Archangiaceae bacterium]
MKTTFAVMSTLLIGCAAPPSLEPTDAGQMTDAGPMADPPDAGSPCDGVQDCRIRWQSAPDFPTVVDHHSTFVATSDAGVFLYVAGGVRSPGDFLYDQVRRAAISADGSLGAWVDCTRLPQPTGFHGFAQRGRHVYLLGGVSRNAGGGAVAGDFSFTGTVQDDGDIHWVQNPYGMHLVALHGTGAIVGDTLYLAGGIGATRVAQSAVVQATLGADGLPGNFTSAPALPLQRTHHVAVVHGGHVYLAGGMDTGNQPIADLLRSEHASDGTLTGWTVVGTLETPPWTASAVDYRDHLFLIGGGEGGPGMEQYVNRVRRARFEPGATLSAFVDVDTLPASHAHVHQTPEWNGHVYSVGGRAQEQLATSAQVFIGTLGGADAGQ